MGQSIPMMEAEGVHYRIGGKEILSGLQFHASAGELTVLLGANGAGKSTLLRLLSGEDRPYKGFIRLRGKSLDDYSPSHLALERAVLTQHYSVTLPFTCAEIVMMGRYPHFRRSPAELDRRIVEECMEALQVRDFAGRLFHTLSGGEQQRVQFARVLAQLGDARSNTEEGKLLLLDEPVSGMDVLHQELCLEKARAFARRGGAVIAVLHDLNLAARFADRIILLNQGRISGEGSPFETLRPELILEVYGIAVEILTHENYPFPLIVPSMTKIHSLTSINNEYANDHAFAER